MNRREKTISKLLTIGGILLLIIIALPDLGGLAGQ